MQYAAFHLGPQCLPKYLAFYWYPERKGSKVDVHLLGGGGGGGRGGTLIFSYIRRLGPFLGVQNFEFQYFLRLFRKMNIFWGMKILWIFFLGHHKIGIV